MAEPDRTYLSMWAEVVVDDDGEPQFRCNEASNRDGEHDMPTMELAANTFPPGTRIEITEPVDDEALVSPAPDQTNAEVSDERLRELIQRQYDEWARLARDDEATAEQTILARDVFDALIALNRRSVTSQASEGEVTDDLLRETLAEIHSVYEAAEAAGVRVEIGHYRRLRNLSNIASPSKRVERLETALKPKAGDAADRIGKWLSAALEDPGVCAEMKADINAWFEAGQPVLKPAMEACDGDLLDFKLHLIAKTADPHADLSIEERSLYALLSLPRAAQAICTEVELETVTTTVTAAMRAAVGRQALQGDRS